MRWSGIALILVVGALCVRLAFQDKDMSGWSDERLVSHFRLLAAQEPTSVSDRGARNRIVEELAPVRDILAARGAASLKKLLPLTVDVSPTVQLEAAILAYDADPAFWGRALRGLLGRTDMVGIWAMIWLLKKDPEFSTQFERNAHREYDRYREEQRRSHPEWSRDSDPEPGN